MNSNATLKIPKTKGEGNRAGKPETAEEIQREKRV